MTFYTVEQKYFDNGTVEVDIYAVNRRGGASVNEQHEGYDLYIDYFTSREAAEEFRQEAMQA